MTKRILLVCNDSLGCTMAGPAIRSWEMARALERRGHTTVVLSRRFDKGCPGNGVTSSGRASLVNLLKYIDSSDCIIQPGSPLSLLLSVVFRKKIVFDQYDPVIFEFLERRTTTVSQKMRKSVMLFLWRLRQRLILSFGYAFLVANEKQKDFLIGQLAARGRAGKAGSIAVVPFGLPGSSPVKKHPVLRGMKIQDTDFLLVWGGGIWDWFDPFTLLKALATIKSRRTDIKVYFPGINPPNPDSRKMAVVSEFLFEARRLDLLDNTVFVNPDWTPYEQRADYLLEADAGISLHRDTLETKYAFRTRMLDYLWAGLPVIASQGDGWAGEIERRGLGITVPCGDVDAVAGAIVKMADDASFRAHCREQSRALAQEYSWDRIVTVLDALCSDADRV
jgi:glycosyltransferase involved in cell wall biosynthesis